MDSNVNDNEINEIVKTIISDFDGGKNIDAIKLFSNPDKDEVRELVENFFRIIYPGYFRDRTYKIYNPKNSFAVTIEDVFYHLKKQVYRALDYTRNEDKLSDDERDKESYRITTEFFKKIPTIREYIETDLLATLDGDPAAGNFDEIILAYPGLMAITVYRIAHELYLLKIPMIPRIMTEHAHSMTGIDIHPGATIGEYFMIDHGTGIVIGETSEIGHHVKIYQGVTIGALSTSGGRALHGSKRHPTIRDNVTIYAGATILGGETVIGKGSVIGANVFITRSIGEDTVVSNKSRELSIHRGTGAAPSRASSGSAGHTP